MAVTVSNLTQGPGTLYSAAFGATEPADADVATAPSASTWTDVGGTLDGVTITVTQEYAELMVDQIIDIPERRITKRDTGIVTRLAEPTLDNLAVALNGGTVSASSGYETYTPATDTSSTQPTYKAFLFDGFAPSSLARRFILRKGLSVEAVPFAYKKDEQTAFDVTVSSHYVSTAITPFRLIDETA